MIENNNLSMGKTFGEHCHLSHPSKPKMYEAKTKLKLLATNSQTSARLLIAEISSTLDLCYQLHCICLSILEVGGRRKARLPQSQLEEVSIQYLKNIDFLKMARTFYCMIVVKMIQIEL